MRRCLEIETLCWVLQIDDQGLVNTDPRFIAVPNTWVNPIPTDVRGLTFSRTPQMVSTLPRASSCSYVHLPISAQNLEASTFTMSAAHPT